MSELLLSRSITEIMKVKERLGRKPLGVFSAVPVSLLLHTTRGTSEINLQK